VAARAARRCGLRHATPLLHALGGLHRTRPDVATVHPSQEWLAGELACHRNTVHRQVVALEAAGILTVYRHRAHQTGEGRYTRATNRMRPDQGACQRIVAGKGPGGAYAPRAVRMSPLQGAKSMGAVPSSTTPPPQVAASAPDRGPPTSAPEQTSPFAGPSVEGRAAIATIRAALGSRRTRGLDQRAPNAGTAPKGR
jgi:hypothetical protein